MGLAAISKAVSSMECFLCREAEDEDSQFNPLETDDEVLKDDSQEAEGVKSWIGLETC